MSSAGTLVLNGTAGNGVVSLSGDGANLVVSGTDMPRNTISNWSPHDTINLASVPSASVTSVGTTANGITIYTTNGNYSLNVPGANTYGYELQADANGDLIYTTCFAEGTAIATPDGEAAVETLSARWTNGQASLSLPANAASAGLRTLTVEILGAGPYLKQNTSAQDMVRQAG